MRTVYRVQHERLLEGLGHPAQEARGIRTVDHPVIV